MVEALAIPARFLLAGVFLAAGLGKLLEPPSARENAVEYALLPPRPARVFSRLLPWMELAIGLLLLSGFFLSSTSPLRAAPFYLGAALLAGFTAAVALVLARGQQVECHCFGRFGGGRVSGGTLARNLLLLALAAVGGRGASAGSVTLAGLGPRPPLAAVVVLALAGLAILTLMVEAWSLSVTTRPRRGPTRS